MKEGDNMAVTEKIKALLSIKGKKNVELAAYLGNKSLLCTKFSNAMYPTGTKII